MSASVARSVTRTRAGEVQVAGFPVHELIGELSYSEIAPLRLRGEVPCCAVVRSGFRNAPHPLRRSYATALGRTQRIFRRASLATVDSVAVLEYRALAI